MMQNGPWESMALSKVVHVAFVLGAMSLTQCCTRSTVEVSLAGRVTSANGDSAKGVAVAAFRVGDLWTRPGLATTWAQTLEDGSFQLVDLDPGKYLVTVTSERGSASVVTTVPISGTALTLQLSTKGNRLSGTVLGGGTSGMPSFTLLRAGLEGGSYLVVGNHDTSYRVILPDGVYSAITSVTDTLVDRQWFELFGDMNLDIGRRLTAESLHPAVESIVKEVRRQSRKLTSTDSKLDVDRIALHDLIAMATVVGLGENTHGAHQFQKINSSVIRYLVEEHGFRVVLIETQFIPTLALNDFLITGEGDPRDILSALYWTSATEEMLDTMRWLREYNIDHPHEEQVMVMGLDYSTPAHTAKTMIERGMSLEPRLSDSSMRLLNDIIEDPNSLSQADLRKLLKELDERSLSLEHIRNPTTGWPVLERLGQQLGCLKVQMNGVAGSLDIRDRCMAETIEWILTHRGEGTRIVVVGHNSHVAKSGVVQGRRSMGSFIKEAHSFYSIGGFLGKGAFVVSDHGLRVAVAPDARLESIEGTLERTGDSGFILPVSEVAESSLGQWLRVPHLTRHIGSTYSEQQDEAYYHFVNLSDAYDALTYWSSVTPTLPLQAMDTQSRLPGPLPAPTNLDFEEGSGEAVNGWMTLRFSEEAGFRISRSESLPNTGRWCGMVKQGSKPPAGRFGNLMQRFDAEAFRGKTVVYRAAVRLDSPDPESTAQLWLRIDGQNDRARFFDSMNDRPIRDKAWRFYELRGEVPEDAAAINIGVVLNGRGAACLDTVSVEAR